MKNYFPFTDYDFYAYLTSGTLLLAVFDLIFDGAKLLTRPSWTVVQIVAAVSAAYVTGHIVAMFSQLVIERFAVSTLLTKPIQLQLGYARANWLERLLGVLVGRYYEPLTADVRTKIITEAQAALSKPSDGALSAEDVFQVGFRRSFAVEDARARIDSFLNQYGFCRNIAFTALVALLLFCWQAYSAGGQGGALLITAAAVVFVTMFVRFIKFYAAFQAEVVRCLLK